ncbi:unnamed protein product [Adineta steineri]|uniref:Cupin-like domain-containing protein n=1 Tax=Adineta steineri TaxID=433720 RepID=A0A814N1V4_9BILA|nr:unnamed protein product [Adineta steineri]CAF1624571.1 unnamed protein product [Adineta steineri]
MNENEKQTDVLNDINNQFKELIELIDKEQDSSFSIEYFDRLRNKKQNSKTKKKKWFIICLILLLSISIYFILLNDELSYNIYFTLLSFIRLILIRILPFWDWTTIYTSQCFLNNPFYNNSFELTECNKCINTTKIITQSNITFFNFTKNIYLNHLPVIVDDATESWPAIKELTVKKLFRLFTEDPVLSEYDLCSFETNVHGYNEPGGADKLFNNYLSGNRRPFMAQWNNCKREALRIIREYYSKPYFLPSSVGQTLTGNWFFISSGLNKETNHLHRIPLHNDWIWLAQIQGSSLIQLRPKHPCEKTCSTLKSIKLNHGDLLIYSHLYNGFYNPLNKETILLAQGVD